MIAAPLQQRRTQAIGSRLQGRHIFDGQKGVIEFTESHSVASQLLSNKRVTVEVAGHVEREVTGDPHAHRAHHRVQHVPVGVQELFSTRLDEAVVGIAARHLPARHIGHERAALLHAGQDTGDALLVLQAPVVGFDQLLFLDAMRCGHDRDGQLVSNPPHPGLVGIGPLLEHGRLDGLDADDVMEEMDQVLRALQPFDVAVQDDAIPARVKELDGVAQNV